MTPWNQRSLSTDQLQWFKNIVTLQKFTQSCMEAIATRDKEATHILSRVEVPGIREHLKILKELDRQNIHLQVNRVLRDQFPEETLWKLEQAVWVVQAWSIRSVLERTKPSELPALKNLLQQAAWKSGKSVAEERWNIARGHFSSSDISDYFYALRDSPLAPPHIDRPFLIRRILKSEVQAELLNCPHHVIHIEAHPITEELCRLHFDWMRGFAYGLNSSLVLQYFPRADEAHRCAVQWKWLKGRSSQAYDKSSSN